MVGVCSSAFRSVRELLTTVDVVGRARERRVDHEVYGERRDIGRFDDAPDRQRGAQRMAAVFQLPELPPNTPTVFPTSSGLRWVVVVLMISPHQSSSANSCACVFPYGKNCVFSPFAQALRCSALLMSQSGRQRCDTARKSSRSSSTVGRPKNQ
jgi:hypothetical protein